MRKLVGMAMVVSLLFSGLAYAQFGKEGKGRLGEKGDELAGKRSELLETLYIWKLVDRLNLSEEQLVKFLPKWKEEKELRKRHQLERKERVKELESLIKSEDPEIEEKLADKLAELEKWESDSQERQKEIREGMKNILTIKQRALLLVSRERFGKDIREILRKVGERKRPEEEKERIEKKGQPSYFRRGGK